MDTLTRNFSFVEEMNDSYLERESYEIEKIMFSLNYTNLAIKGRKISEYVLQKYYKLKGKSLYELISDYKIYYSKYIVKDALHYIRRWGNVESHHNDEGEEIDFTTALHLVKSISVLLRDAYKMSKSKKEDNFVFSEKPYLPDGEREILAKGKITISNKINDQEVTVSKTTIIDLFANKNVIFNIPYYQREYTWDYDNIDTLLNDIEARKEDNHTHYFGVIAIKEEIVDGKIHIRIIDGQQRITTSILLLKAGENFLKKYYSDEIMNNMPDYFLMFNDNFENRYLNESQEVEKLKEWTQIMENKFEVTSNKNSHWQYGKNYGHIFDYFMKIMDRTEVINSHLEIIDFINIFANKFELAIVKYNVKKKREMNIFENMNSKGTELTEWNLVKNQILNLVEIKNITDQEKISTLNNDFYYPFVGNLIDTDKYLNEFITEYVWFSTILEKKPYNTYSRFPIYNNFKEIFKNSIQSREKYATFLERMRKYGTIFRALDKKNITIFNEILENNQSRIDNIVTKKQIYPLLFMIFKKTSKWKDGSWDVININELRACIEILDTWLTRAEVVSGFGHSIRTVAVSIATDIYHDKTNNLVSSLISSMYKNNLFKDDNAFRSALINSRLKETLLKKIVYQFEIYLQDKAKSSNFNLKINESTLEHVMPKAYNNWEKDIIGELSQEEFRELYKENVGKLGNMMILPKSQNSSVKNESWIIKKRSFYYQNRPIIMGDKSLNLEPFEAIEQWNFETIKKRTEAIADILVKHVYPLPKHQ